MNQQTKRKIKNAAKTGGKYALKGLKLAGKGACSLTELTAKGVSKVAKSDKAKRFIAGATTIAGTVAFIGPAITLSTISFLTQNILLGKRVSPVGALKQITNVSTNVLEGVLDVVSPVAQFLAKGLGKVANKGYQALDK